MRGNALFVSNVISSIVEKDEDLYFERNRLLFDVRRAVNFQHEPVNKSSSDSVGYFTSTIQRLELLRPRVALKQNDRRLEESVICASNTHGKNESRSLCACTG
jgi:hypothetical protein